MARFFPLSQFIHSSSGSTLECQKLLLGSCHTFLAQLCSLLKIMITDWTINPQKRRWFHPGRKVNSLIILTGCAFMLDINLFSFSAARNITTYQDPPNWTDNHFPSGKYPGGSPPGTIPWRWMDTQCIFLITFHPPCYPLQSMRLLLKTPWLSNHFIWETSP